MILIHLPSFQGSSCTDLNNFAIFISEEKEKEAEKEKLEYNGDEKAASDESLKVSNYTMSRPSSICSDLEHESSQTHWVDFVTVPLMMAYVTRYIFGTDKLRPNAFEVRGLNGINTGIIHCDDLAILSQWLKYITDNIIGLTNLQVECLTFRFEISLLNRKVYLLDEALQ